MITTPHDPEARFTAHDDKTWNSYQVHWTETCDAERPHLITHVETTSADTRDMEVLPRIHVALEKLDLLPTEHWVDTGYTSGPNLIDSQRNYGVRLIGPLHEDRSWQAKAVDGITLDQFQIDFQQRQATCPQGHVSSRWSAKTREDGQTEVQVAFRSAVCQACAVRQYCTKSKKRGRMLTLGMGYAPLQAGRQRQHTAAFWEEYKLRAGVEGTVSAVVRQHGVCRARYRGRTKTQVQSLLTAIAVNVRRAALWLRGRAPGNGAASEPALLGPGSVCRLVLANKIF